MFMVITELIIVIFVLILFTTLKKMCLLKKYIKYVFIWFLEYWMFLIDGFLTVNIIYLAQFELFCAHKLW